MALAVGHTCRRACGPGSGSHLQEGMWPWQWVTPAGAVMDTIWCHHFSPSSPHPQQKHNPHSHTPARAPCLPGPHACQGPMPARAPCLPGPHACRGPMPARATCLPGPHACRGPTPARAPCLPGPHACRATCHTPAPEVPGGLQLFFEYRIAGNVRMVQIFVYFECSLYIRN